MVYYSSLTNLKKFVSTEKYLKIRISTRDRDAERQVLIRGLPFWFEEGCDIINHKCVSIFFDNFLLNTKQGLLMHR